ncbi:hypothetical protein D3C86_1270930 [compost metagenome]
MEVPGTIYFILSLQFLLRIVHEFQDGFDPFAVCYDFFSRSRIPHPILEFPEFFIAHESCFHITGCSFLIRLVIPEKQVFVLVHQPGSISCYRIAWNDLNLCSRFPIRNTCSCRNGLKVRTKKFCQLLILPKSS